MKQDIESGFKKKTRRKLILQFLCGMVSFTLLFGILPISAEQVGYSATLTQGEIAYVDSISMTEWLGKDTEDQKNYTKISISSADELKKFSVFSNTSSNGDNRSFSGKTIFLTCNIDMGKVVDFYPICAAYNQFDTGNSPGAFFKGVFDGCGFVIDNLTVLPMVYENKGITEVGLFGTIGTDGTIKNVILGRNCHFEANTEETYVCVGSVVARASQGAKIQNVLNLGTVSGGNCTGGLVGRTNGTNSKTVINITIEKCTNYGAVTGTSYVGGIIGFVNSGINFESNRNVGTVTSSKGYAGGIIGGVGTQIEVDEAPNFPLNLNSQINNGTVLGKAGGIVGYLNDEIPNLGSIEFINCLDYAVKDNHFGKVASGKTYSAQPAEETDSTLSCVKFHGYQIRKNGEDKMDVRLIASIDRGSSNSCVKAGFEIENVDTYKKVEKECTQLFTSLLAKKDSGNICYTSEQLSGSDSYLFAFVIENIPTDQEITLNICACATIKTGDDSTTLKRSNTVRIELNKSSD